ncbi:MAG: hypothetical protein Q4B59_02165 [Lachnospiraceae bacterium]|nr:hypothetical protein [Lachnospiraceae bacterium]
MQDFNVKMNKKSERGGSWQRVACFLLLLALLLGTLNVWCLHLWESREEMIPVKLKHLAGVQQEPENTLDLLVLGNSLSYTSVSNMDLWNSDGIAGYQCGHSGQTVQEAYETLRIVLGQQCPRVVLLETNALFRGRDGSMGWADQFDTWLAYRVPFLQLHDMWKSALFGVKRVEENYKGYTFRTQQDPYTGEEYMVEAEEEEGFHELSKRYMDRIVRLCRDKDVRLILFSSVSPVNYSQTRIDLLEAYCREMDVEYIDFNAPGMREQVGIDWTTDSLDGGDHLNHTGAKKITAYLREYLREEHLPDRRGDGRYVSWEEAGRAYLEAENG